MIRMKKKIDLANTHSHRIAILFVMVSLQLIMLTLSDVDVVVGNETLCVLLYVNLNLLDFRKLMNIAIGQTSQ